MDKLLLEFLFTSLGCVYELSISMRDFKLKIEAEGFRKAKIHEKLQI